MGCHHAKGCHDPKDSHKRPALGVNTCISLSSSVSGTTTPGASATVGKYSFRTQKVLSESAFGVTYLGTDPKTGERVAIKLYKFAAGSHGLALEKFKLEVATLVELQEPFRPPTDERLWSEELAKMDPSDLFARLLDYSKDADGNPGCDPEDGSLFLVTEAAQTLKKELRQRSRGPNAMSVEEVRKCAKEIVEAVAGLHSKGFVHADLSPASIMLCGGRWKLCHLDGCTRVDAQIDQKSAPLSVSHLYMAPEVARFLLEGGAIAASPLWDAWSVGLIVAELVSMESLMRGPCSALMAGKEEKDNGIALFLEWLASVTAVPLPQRKLTADDAHLFGFLQSRLLVPVKTRRSNVVECLSAPYFVTQPIYDFVN